MTEISRIGIDLAKSVFQVHAVDRDERVVLRRSFKRGALIAFLAKLQPCTIGMEACGSAHGWARRFQAMGQRVVLLPPAYVKPYVKRGKSDAADAEAICEAMARPGMRTVPVKTAEQQAMLALHRTRDGAVRERTAQVNRLRGLLAEFGLIAPKGQAGRMALLRLARAAAAELPPDLVVALEVLARQIAANDDAVEQLEARIAAAAKDCAQARLLQTIPGIGPITASAFVATIGDASRFRSPRHLSAWLGLTPRQDSSGGKTRLRGISKMGDGYLRRLLVLGATGQLRLARAGRSPNSAWINKLLASKPPRLVTLALANKIARIVRAVLATSQPYRAPAEHSPARRAA